MITVTKEAELSPDDLAREFCDMDSDGQAEFFNILGGIVKSKGSRGAIELDYIFAEGFDNNGNWLIGQLSDRFLSD